MTSVPDPMFLGDEWAEVCIPNVGNAGGEPQEPPGHHREVRLFPPQPVGLPTKTVLLHGTLSKIKQNTSFIVLNTTYRMKKRRGGNDKESIEESKIRIGERRYSRVAMKKKL